MTTFIKGGARVRNAVNTMYRTKGKKGIVFITLLAVCIIVLAGVTTVISKKNWNELRQKSGLVSGCSIGIIIVIIGLVYLFHWKKGDKSLWGTGFVFALCVLGYLMDWLSLLLDITRFSELKTYQYGGNPAEFLTGTSGRQNSTCTGCLAMLLDVMALWSAGHGNTKNTLIVFFCMHIFANIFLQLYGNGNDGWHKQSVLARGTGIAGVCVSLLSVYYLHKISSPQTGWPLYMVLGIVGCITTWYVNETLSNLKFFCDPNEPDHTSCGFPDTDKCTEPIIVTGTDGQQGVEASLPTDDKYDPSTPRRGYPCGGKAGKFDTTEAEKHTWWNMTYGLSKTRIISNLIVVMCNVTSGWQGVFNAFYTALTEWGVGGLADMPTLMNVVYVLYNVVAGLIVPQYTNYVNIAGQMALTSEDLAIPDMYDNSQGDEMEDATIWKSIAFYTILAIAMSVYFFYMLGT